MSIIRTPVATLILILSAGGVALASAGGAAWGERGHRMVATAAVRGLPGDVPVFFTEASAQLEYLNPEPDRWRDREARAMDGGFQYDHYLDLEVVPEGALDAPDRFGYLAALYAAGLDAPHRAAGFLPFRILELTERLTSGFARWRTAASAEERRWIEDRIINDAGVLGHYVADAANPHHTTIHFNGWAEGSPNPRGFTTERDFHWRFESRFVGAHVALDEVIRAVPPGTRVLDDVRSAVLDFIAESNRQVEPLYRLEQRFGFSADRAAPEEKAFAIARLAAAADMLRSIWYTAWVDSEAVAARRP